MALHWYNQLSSFKMISLPHIWTLILQSLPCDDFLPFAKQILPSIVSRQFSLMVCLRWYPDDFLRCPSMTQMKKSCHKPYSLTDHLSCRDYLEEVIFLNHSYRLWIKRFANPSARSKSKQRSESREGVNSLRFPAITICFAKQIVNSVCKALFNFQTSKLIGDDLDAD